MKKQKIKKRYESIPVGKLIKTSKVAGRQLAVGGPTANHANERVSRARARERKRDREKRERERVTRVRARVNDAWYFSKKASSSMRCA